MARAACLALDVLLLAFTGTAHAASSWLAPTPVSPPNDPVPTEDLFTFGAKVAFDGNGNALLVWPRQDGSTLRVQAAFRPAGGSFGAPVDISGVATACPGCGLEIQVAFDPQGNALAAWNLAVGANQRIQMVVGESNPQRLSGVQGALAGRKLVGRICERSAHLV